MAMVMAVHLNWTVPLAKTKAANCGACEKKTMPRTVATMPTMMKGLLRPQRLVHRSLRVPTMGATMRPDNGPTTQTLWLITSPAFNPFSKYGVVIANWEGNEGR